MEISQWGKLAGAGCALWFRLLHFVPYPAPMFDPANLTPDDRRHFYRRTALAAACLCLVAGMHLWRVMAYDQTRWKGGGFGMFSTVDAETARYLKVFLIAADGTEFPVRVPDSLAKRGAVLRAIPDVSLATELAQRIGALRYYREDEMWVEVLAAKRLPAIVTQADLPQPSALVADAALPSGMKSEWQPVPNDDQPNAGFRPAAVRVEVWRHVYDGETNRLLAKKILAVTANSESGGQP